LKKSLSSKKRVRQNERRKSRNRAIKSTIRSRVKKATESGLSDDRSAAYSAIDTAVKSNLLHKKTAARMKSKFARVKAQEKPS
jgi:small subunit ribosomal protein S20